MFARFDENPAMTLRVIKETKRYGRTDARTDGRTDNVKTVYPLQTKFAGGIKLEHLLFRSKCSIFHNVFKSIQNLNFFSMWSIKEKMMS